MPSWPGQTSLGLYKTYLARPFPMREVSRALFGIYELLYRSARESGGGDFGDRKFVRWMRAEGRLSVITRTRKCTPCWLGLTDNFRLPRLNQLRQVDQLDRLRPYTRWTRWTR